MKLERFEEARSLLRRTISVARRVLGENEELTLRMRSIYATALYVDNSATLENLREAVKTLEDGGNIAQRVFGGGHPTTVRIEQSLRRARAVLSTREGDRN